MWPVIGQDRIIAYLERALGQGTLAHAYLFIGPAHVGKMTLAVSLAQALNCKGEAPPCGECSPCRKIAAGGHADVQVIGLAGSGNGEDSRPRAEIGIDRIRQLQHSASLTPFEGRYKVYIIDGAEQLSLEAANCLLKTLEEPVGRVVFILLTANVELLPATVVSRCQRLELSPLAADEIEPALVGRWGIEPPKAKLLSRLCRGCPGWALAATADTSLLEQRAERLGRLLEVIGADYEVRFDYAAELASQFGRDRGLVYEVLELWRDFWRDLMLVKTGCRQSVVNIDLLPELAGMAEDYSLAETRAIIGSIQTVREQLGQNANPQLALEVLMLGVPRKERAARKALISDSR